MTGFFEEVGYFRMCSNHASEMRLLRSALVSCDGAVRRAVLVDQDEMVQESARVNLAERFLRGVVGELPERPGSFRAVVVLLARRDFPAGSFVQIFEIEAAAPRRLARENHSRLHRSSKFSRTRSSLASMRRENLRIDLVLDRHREEDGLEGRRLRFETERFVERGEARLRLGCAVHVELRCWSFLRVCHDHLMRLSIWLTEVKLVRSCEVSRRAPDARRDSGKTRFFPRGRFPYGNRYPVLHLRYELGRRGRGERGAGMPRPRLNATVKTGVSPWYAVLVEPAKAKRISAG